MGRPMRAVPHARRMAAHGYTLEKTGGGLMWFKRMEGGYLTITDEDLSLTSDADAHAWRCERYLGFRPNVYGWVVSQPHTLEEALAIADKLPLPQQGDEVWFDRE
jgi:hypothetical protein